MQTVSFIMIISTLFTNSYILICFLVFVQTECTNTTDGGITPRFSFHDQELVEDASWKSKCPSGYTNCPDGNCIDINLNICNGEEDCSDGLDENPSVCQNVTDPSKFECLNGIVIDALQVCDGNNDCKDGIDEADVTCAPIDSYCHLPNKISLRFQCKFKGKPITCGDRARAKTNVKVFCSHGYVPDKNTQWIDTNKCLKGGEWLHPMPDCSYVCGVSSNNKYPWNVAIYEPKGSGYQKRCYGTLITPAHVVTGNSCTRNVHKGSLRSTIEENLYKDQLKIGLKLDTEFDFIEGEEVERLVSVKRLMQSDYFYLNNYHDVTYKLPNKTSSLGYTPIQKHDWENWTSIDYVVYQVTVAELSFHVDLKEYTPVCFDREGKLEINSTTRGMVAMLNSYVNKTNSLHEIRILPHHECVEYYNQTNFLIDTEDVLIKPEKYNLAPDEICTIHDEFTDQKNWALVPEVLEGAGLVIDVNGTHYLYGVYKDTTAYLYNYKSKNGVEFLTHGVHVFSDVRAGTAVPEMPGHYFNVIADLFSDTHYLYKQDFSTDCNIPFADGTVYTKETCVTEYSPCTELPTHRKMDEHSVIFIHCKPNYTLKGRYNHRTCINGNWLPEHTSCVRLCGPLTTAPSVSAHCTNGGKNVSCTDNVMADTVAKSTCKNDVNKDLIFYENTCLHSGNWRDSPEVIEVFCIDLCGVLKSERALVENGEEVNATYHPWNAGLYYNYKKDRFGMICGGTLISKYAVLSAAHCVYNEDGERIGPEKFQIGLAKYYRKYNHKLDKQAQMREVASVNVPYLYDGPPSGFGSDIAILELKKAADLNEFVIPACIDTTNKFTVKPRTMGSVVGWGLNGVGKNAKPTDELMKAELPYLKREQCINEVKRIFNKTIRITVDKFCAAHFIDEKAIVRPGDSGSGMTFKFEGRHYVYGLVSIQANNMTSMFTNVTYPDHLDFINRVLNKIITNRQASVQ